MSVTIEVKEMWLGKDRKGYLDYLTRGMGAEHGTSSFMIKAQRSVCHISVWSQDPSVNPQAVEITEKRRIIRGSATDLLS